MRPTDRRRAAVIVFAVSAIFTSAACTADAGVQVPARTSQGSPSETAALEPTPSALGSADAPPESLGVAEFWEYVGGTDLVESYDSLAAMVEASDLVVDGIVSEFRDGRRIQIPGTGETLYEAELVIDMTASLHGEPVPTGSPHTVTVEWSYGFAKSPSRLAALQASAPIGSRVVLFLVNEAADAARHGIPDTPGADSGYYLLLRGDQAAIWDEGGIARAGRGVESQPWLAGLDGAPFEKVLDAVASVSPATK